MSVKLHANPGNLILRTGNKSGKTYTCTLYDVHDYIYEKLHVLCLLVSQSSSIFSLPFVSCALQEASRNPVEFKQRQIE